MTMKAIKNRIWLVAIALIATTLGACTSDRLDVDEPVMKKVYTLTTTLSQPDYATTRLQLIEGGTGVKIAWQVSDTLNVAYDKSDYSTDNTGTAIIKSVDSNGVATVRVYLYDPQDGGNITFKYPRAKNNENEYTQQKGTLEDIQKNYATLYGSGKMIVTGGSVTLNGDVEMYRLTAIWKFTFTDGTNYITSDIKKLTLTFKEEDEDPVTYEVNPTSPLDEIYVAINNDFVFYTKEVIITAPTSLGVYSKSFEKVPLSPGKFYVSEGVELTKKTDV